MASVPLESSVNDDVPNNTNPDASTKQKSSRDAFDLIGQDARVARTSRMIASDEPITTARRKDIRKRVIEYLEKHSITRATLARETAISPSVASEVLRGTYGVGKGIDDTKYLRRINNWMELHSRRQNVVHNKEFVETSVAREIITVAELTAETCKIGVVWGPAQIGKSFTLQSLHDSDRLGNPVYICVDEAHRTPLSVCQLILAAFGQKTWGKFGEASSRLFAHLNATKRMLMFDESDRLSYRALEFVRDLHDKTGCPILLAGKPAIYQKLGYRDIGTFTEVTDQLSSRVIIRRDLTERTRTIDHDPNFKPQPLFTRKDIKALIKVANLDLKVHRDAIDWLQDRACSLGMGGFGKAKINLYLACKIALGSGHDTITAAHLDAVERTTIGAYDSDRVEATLEKSSSKEIRRLA